MTEIYKATNTTNGKSYIGLTDECVWTRHEQHYAESLRGSTTHFHNALRKHPVDVWMWEVLCDCPTREEAGRVEACLIAAFDTYRNGYNSTTGGDKGWTLSEERRKQQSVRLRGRKLTPEHRAAISAGNKGRRCSTETKAKISCANRGRKLGPSWNKGTPCSAATRRKIGDANRGRKRNDEMRARMSAALIGNTRNKGRPWSAARRAAWLRSKGVK